MKKIPYLFTARILASVLITGHVHAESGNLSSCAPETSSIRMEATDFCIETGSGGLLTAGSMPQDLFEGLFATLITKVDELGFDVQLFKVQKSEGFYGKVCNSVQHKTYFFEVFEIDGWNESHWDCQFRPFTSDEAEELVVNSPSTNGIMRIDIVEDTGNLTFRVCEYRGVHEVTTNECWAIYENGNLHIPCVKVKGPFGEESRYEADMQYKPLSEPMSFELKDARQR